MLIFVYLSLFSYVYETERHNGIAELLEILGRYALLNLRSMTYFDIFYEFLPTVLYMKQSDIIVLLNYLKF